MLAPGEKGQQFLGLPGGMRGATREITEGSKDNLDSEVGSHTHAPGLRPGAAESASAHSTRPCVSVCGFVCVWGSGVMGL